MVGTDVADDFCSIILHVYSGSGCSSCLEQKREGVTTGSGRRISNPWSTLYSSIHSNIDQGIGWGLDLLVSYQCNNGVALLCMQMEKRTPQSSRATSNFHGIHFAVGRSGIGTRYFSVLSRFSDFSVLSYERLPSSRLYND